ncbi:hypothetical protein D3C87_1591020 [compost metagenome]
MIDASFAKLRDITLSYNLPNQWLKKYGIEQLRVFGQAGNILLWSANKYGIDPEFQNARITSGTGRTLRTGQNAVSFGINLSL